ncbi:MAG: hypothetical protein AAF737_10430, partial [Pseudomonadota bacterium]
LDLQLDVIVGTRRRRFRALGQADRVDVIGERLHRQVAEVGLQRKRQVEALGSSTLQFPAAKPALKTAF